MDDIVTRLREAHKNADEVASVFLTNEAANEIERLLKLVQVFHVLAKRFYEQTEDAAKEARKAFDEAVGHG